MDSEDRKPASLIRCRCLFCGQLFWSGRSDTTYCKASCKQKMYRWRRKLDTETTKALVQIRKIASYLTYDKSTPFAVAALNQIRAEIYETLLKQKVVIVK